MQFAFRSKSVSGSSNAFLSAGRFLRRRFLLPVLIRESPEIQKLFGRAFSAGAARRMRIRGPIRPKIVRGIVRA